MSQAAESQPDEWMGVIKPAPAYFPTLAEFQDPIAYIQKISPVASQSGICRIVPPDGWKPKFSVELDTLVFRTRIQNIAKLSRKRDVSKNITRKPLAPPKVDVTHVETMMCEICDGGTHEELMLLCDGCGNGFHTFCLTPPLATIPEEDEWFCANCKRQDEEIGFEDGKHYSYQKFSRVASVFHSRYFGEDVTVTPAEVEKHFWGVVEGREREVEVLYGSDLDTGKVGSGFPRAPPGDTKPPSDVFDYPRSPWNLNNFARQPGSLLMEMSQDITGVTVPWLYFGMLFSTFCWHNEDHYMYSVAYHHRGATKVWYGVPGDKAKEFEAVMKATMPETFEAHPDLLYQLVTIFSPGILLKHNIPVVRAHHNPGEFIVTFPGAYHAGFSCGVSCTEAVNFATADWLPYGYSSVQHYRLYRRNPIFSHEEMVFSCANHWKKQFFDGNSFKHVVNQLEKLKTVEKALRSRLRPAQLNGMEIVRCVGSSTVNGKQFDSLKNQHCVICKNQLFLSGVSCDCAPRKLVCLYHADVLCSCAPKHRYLHVRYTLQELDIITQEAAKHLKIIAGRFPGNLLPASPASQDTSPSPSPSPSHTPAKAMKLEPSPPVMVAVKTEAVDEKDVPESPPADPGTDPTSLPTTPCSPFAQATPRMGTQFPTVTSHHLDSLKRKSRVRKREAPASDAGGDGPEPPVGRDFKQLSTINKAKLLRTLPTIGKLKQVKQ